MSDEEIDGGSYSGDLEFDAVDVSTWSCSGVDGIAQTS